MTGVSLRSPGAVWRVVGDGQSLWFTPTITLAMAVMSGRGIPWEVVAVGGTGYANFDATPGLESTVTTRLYPQAGHATNTVLVMFGGTSDVAHDFTGQQMYDKEVQYGNNARTAGFTYVINTTLPDSTVYNPTQDGTRADRNTLMLADASSAFNGVANVSAAIPDATVTAQFPDGLHLDVAAINIIAPIVAAELEALPGFPAG